MGRQAKGVRLIRLDADQKLHNVVAFEGGDDAADDSGDETGVVIETRSLPVTEDADNDDESEEGDESDDEEPEDDEEPADDDLEYEEEDADDIDEDENVEL